MQDEMMDLVDYSSEIQETLGRSYNVPDDLDEEELMGGEILLQLPLSIF
jgi:charged multivesicular body protein 5